MRHPRGRRLRAPRAWVARRQAPRNCAGRVGNAARAAQGGRGRYRGGWSGLASRISSRDPRAPCPRRVTPPRFAERECTRSAHFLCCNSQKVQFPATWGRRRRRQAPASVPSQLGCRLRAHRPALREGRHPCAGMKKLFLKAGFQTWAWLDKPRCSPLRGGGRTLSTRRSGRAPLDSAAQNRRSPRTALERPNCPAFPRRLRPRDTPFAPAAPRAAWLSCTVTKIQWAGPVGFRGSDPLQRPHNPNPHQPSLPKPTSLKTGCHILHNPLLRALLGGSPCLSNSVGLHPRASAPQTAADPSGLERRTRRRRPESW